MKKYSRVSAYTRKVGDKKIEVRAFIRKNKIGANRECTRSLNKSNG